MSQARLEPPFTRRECTDKASQPMKAEPWNVGHTVIGDGHLGFSITSWCPWPPKGPAASGTCTVGYLSGASTQAALTGDTLVTAVLASGYRPSSTFSQLFMGKGQELQKQPKQEVSTREKEGQEWHLDRGQVRSSSWHYAGSSR